MPRAKAGIDNRPWSAYGIDMSNDKSTGLAERCALSYLHNLLYTSADKIFSNLYQDHDVERFALLQKSCGFMFDMDAVMGYKLTKAFLEGALGVQQAHNMIDRLTKEILKNQEMIAALDTK